MRHREARVVDGPKFRAVNVVMCDPGPTQISEWNDTNTLNNFSTSARLTITC
jgi:hypothetical protein